MWIGSSCDLCPKMPPSVLRWYRDSTRWRGPDRRRLALVR
jgi:hypothetical protein